MRCCGRLVRNFARRHFRFCIFVVNLYIITFAMVLPILCNDWAHSNYYFPGWTRSHMEHRAATLNEHHASKAEEYIARINVTREAPHLPAERSTDVDLVIGIVTVPRFRKPYKLGYLTQSFVAIHKNMRQDRHHFARRALFLCNVNAGPNNHTELTSLEVSNVPVFHRFPKLNSSVPEKTSRFEKEKEDYIFCLEAALDFKPKYVLMVQDDALARNNFFEILHFVLMNTVEKRITSGERRHNEDEWAYLKLYYPDRWKGYAFEIVPVLEMLAIASIGGSAFALVASACRRRAVGAISRWTHFLVGFVYFACLAHMIGRPYVLEWRRLSTHTYAVVPAPDCCSPAILYPARKAQQLSWYLKNVTCHPKHPVDLAMDEFAKVHQYKRYLVEPNLMQHIGMFSSLKTKSRHPERFIYR